MKSVNTKYSLDMNNKRTHAFLKSILRVLHNTPIYFLDKQGLLLSAGT